MITVHATQVPQHIYHVHLQHVPAFWNARQFHLDVFHRVVEDVRPAPVVEDRVASVDQPVFVRSIWDFMKINNLNWEKTNIFCEKNQSDNTCVPDR